MSAKARYRDLAERAKEIGLHLTLVISPEPHIGDRAEVVNLSTAPYGDLATALDDVEAYVAVREAAREVVAFADQFGPEIEDYEARWGDTFRVRP